MTKVDEFWNREMVGSGVHDRIRDAKADLSYLRKRNEMYPMFKELMGIWGDHKGQVVLDYGCGPGDDLVGFLCHSKALKVIGMDISDKALSVALRRIGYHRESVGRYLLGKTVDDYPTMPLLDASVDYIHCGGVLQHTTCPEGILREFYRVLKPKGTGRIMVYQTDSIWLHLYVAYIIQILQGKYSDMPALEAYPHTTDGDDCPIARAYDPPVFEAMLEGCGFRARYLGAYFSHTELKLLKDFKNKALEESRLAEEHKRFLRDIRGGRYPTYQGKFCGVSGCFEVAK